MKYFYSHIIEIESVLVKLDEIDLSNDQKKHLAHLVDSTIHQTVLDLILSKLSKSDRRTLVAKMKENPEDKDLMKFVKEKVENIHERLGLIIHGKTTIKYASPRSVVSSLRHTSIADGFTATIQKNRSC